MKRTALGLLAAAGVVCGFGLEAQATSIDFNNAVGGSANCVENSLQPCFGSHVNNTTDPNGFGTYGVGNGFTPNVEVDYTGTNQRIVTSYAGAIYATSFHGSQHIFTLTADAGFNVQLNEILVRNVDLPGLSQSETFEVWADGVHLSSFDAVYSGLGGTSTTFTFANLVAQTISIIGDSALVGIGAANFDQIALAATPIPAALPLFGAGLAGLGFAGWRKKRQTAKPA
jgi:hypothetical protein